VIGPDPDPARTQAARAKLRQALDQSLPEITADELPESAHEAKSDAEYQRDRPPHHGG